MSQDNVIFLFIFTAFIFFVTQRGELPKYMGYLFGTPNQSGSNPFGSIFSGAAQGGIATALNPGSAIPGAQGPTSVGGPSGPAPLVT